MLHLMDSWWNQNKLCPKIQNIKIILADVIKISELSNNTQKEIADLFSQCIAFKIKTLLKKSIKYMLCLFANLLK